MRMCSTRLLTRGEQPSEETRAFAPTWKTRYSSITDIECKAYATGVPMACDKVNNWLTVGDDKSPLPMEAGGVITKTQAEYKEITSRPLIPLVNPQSPDFEKRLNCERPPQNARCRTSPRKPTTQVELTCTSNDQEDRCQHANPANGPRNCQWAAIRGERFCLLHTPGGLDWLRTTVETDDEQLRFQATDDGEEHPDT
jgi:hypothetical protein